MKDEIVGAAISTMATADFKWDFFFVGRELLLLSLNSQGDCH